MAEQKSLGEFELIQGYFAQAARYIDSPSVVQGIGDDCAVLDVPAGQQLLTSVDTLLEGVHFESSINPADLSWRAVAAAASDLAACGAAPLAMTLAISLPEVEEAWITEFCEGLVDICDELHLPLVGGDTTKGPLSISVQVMGTVPKGQAILRSGAKPGDHIWVSGELGLARAALDYLDKENMPEVFAQAYFAPQPQLQLGQSLLGVASAAADISDGLLADLSHILDASGVGAVVDAVAVPAAGMLFEHYSEEQAFAYALMGGDDYELVFTAPADMAETLDTIANSGYINLTNIGEIRAEPGLVSSNGEALPTKGYDHFG